MVKAKTETTFTLESFDFMHWIPDPIKLQWYKARLEAMYLHGLLFWTFTEKHMYLSSKMRLIDNVELEKRDNIITLKSLEFIH